MIASTLSGPQRRALEKRIPYRVHVIVTHTCNLSCEHCYQAEHSGPELSLHELTRALEQMAAMGTTFLVVGGGEPLARRDIWALLAEARRLRFAVELYTNGTLVDADAARRLRELGVVRAHVSVHGESAATHDRFVRRQGALERIERGVTHLSEAGIPVVVRSTGTRENHREVALLPLKYSGRKLVTFGGIGTDLHVRDDGDDTPVMYRMTEPQERELVRGRLAARGREAIEAELTRLARADAAPPSENIPCQAARTYFALQPNGDVTPCTQTTSHVMGNVRQRPLDEIWRDSAAAAKFRALDLNSFTKASAVCAECRFRNVCARCPSLSEQHSGSLSGWNAQTCQTTTVYWTELLRRAGELGLAVPE